MATIIAKSRLLATAQVHLKRDIHSDLQSVTDAVRTIIMRHTVNSFIPTNRRRELQVQVGNVVSNYFVGVDGRNAYASDNVTPLSPFARTLNKWYAWIVMQEVKTHKKWLQDQLPDDLAKWLSSATLPAVSETITLTPAALRVYSANSLIKYDPMHTWVDANGYQLSDRIWNTSIETRKKLDALLADMLKNGTSSERLAKLVEQFLLPGRADLRTKRPYGRDASYNAMRLARTEIAAAANRAALLSAQLNPYVTSIEIARSANGDANCKICPQHATLGINGERLRPAYDKYAAPLSTFHPHCLCHTRSVVEDSAAVTKRLREWYQSDEPAPYSPFNDVSLLIYLLGALYTLYQADRGF